jgi:thiol:disulfide interchange protein DsbD
MTRLLALLLCALLGTPVLGQSEFGGGSLGSLDGSSDGFLPVEQAYPLDVVDDGEGHLTLYWATADGYYLYRHRFAFNAVRDGERSTLEAVIPSGIMKDDEFFGLQEVYYGNLAVRLDTGAREPGWFLEVKSQGCADAGLCYPPRTQYFEIGATGIAEVAALPAAGARGSATTAPAGGGSAGGAAPTVALMLLFALLGGVILNLMPCVFPVLSLKALSLASSARSDGNHQLLHGLVYSAGVVLCFVLVAALLLALRGAGAAVGWGFHLQEPWFVAALAYLFVAMGLSLSGLLEFGAGMMGIGGNLASRGGLGGSFFTGVLAAVVASPCTAPFMGTALGFAMTQPAIVALAIFASLGFGMALPFLLLALFPGLLRRMPAPGPWMETFRQLMAFPLYGAAVWLLWVLGKQTGVNGMAAVCAGLVLLALAMWLGGRLQRGEGRWLSRAMTAAAVVAALLVLRSPLLTPQAAATAGGDGWEPYSDARASELRSSGQTYFVNVTADWCITCLANERVALSNGAVREAFERLDVVYLKGDWTNSDPKLTELLRRHDRSGVPLYLLVSPELGIEVLPQLLTPGIVLDALQRHAG